MAASSEVCLELKSFLQFISDHLSDGQGGACSRWRGIAYVQNPAGQLSLPTVKHKIIHQVSFSIQSLCTHTRRPPAQTFTSRATVIINENMYHFYNLNRVFVCLYLRTSLGLSSGMNFCRFFTWALVNTPLYISPIPYTIFFITSLCRPLHTHTHTHTHTQTTPTRKGPCF